MTDNKKPLLGDRVASVLRKTRADRVAKAYSRITKKPCNCAQRQQQLNDLHKQWKDQNKK